jgi:hypothetical protein
VTVVSDLLALSPEVPAAEAPGFTPGVSFRRELMLLRAVFGQDEANHGTLRYPVDADGLIWVPLEAAGPLIAKGGFAVPDTPDDAVSAGILKLHHHAAAGCCYGGRRYPGDENGDVLVPAEAASELLAHGFVPVLQGTTPASRRAKPILGDRSTKGLMRWPLTT